MASLAWDSQIGIGRLVPPQGKEQTATPIARLGSGVGFPCLLHHWTSQTGLLQCAISIDPNRYPMGSLPRWTHPQLREESRSFYPHCKTPHPVLQ